ncbi:hypothetical protein [Burkholderia cenocepacia]|uniref:hypothetical protein n=1 Tax=Burkholderia cenocepacia TaxID=95486 RepID=UPI0007613883|nr:hypothetical protein [Burkholderia cenocepacia]KWU23427.1 hypothetical protein AS149_37190 [Burkholderia cenocepacia]
MAGCTKEVTAIFELSDEGLFLNAEDLRLLDRARGDSLTEQDARTLSALHDDVTSRRYFEKLRWLHGIEHLTRRPDGYVFWKDAKVEHFTFSDAHRSLAAAERLAARCRLLESKGFPVTGRTVSNKAILEAPAETPLLHALLHYYAFFEGKDGTVAGVFYTRANDSNPLETLSVSKVDGAVVSEKRSSGYTAYRIAESRGARSVDVTSAGYEEFADVMARTNLTSEELMDVLK